MEEEIKIKDKQPKFSFAIFILSFAPYLFIVWATIFGIAFFFSNEYGFDGAFIAILAGTIEIPVFPALLIFQIIYAIVKYKWFSKVQKTITKSVVIGLLAAVLIPGFVYLVKNKVNDTVKKNNETKLVEEYLTDKYGDYAKEMEIIETLFIDDDIYIQTPLLKSRFRIILNDQRTKIRRDTFYDVYIEENDLTNKYSEYIKNKYELPKNVTAVIKINSFNLKNVDNIDDLIIDSDYIIETYNMNVITFNKEQIINDLIEFDNKYGKDLESHYKNGMVSYHIMVKGEVVVSIRQRYRNNTYIDYDIDYQDENSENAHDTATYNIEYNKLTFDSEFNK